ncbi:MAG TPA: DUF5691 domain-containing protein, partial [Verrucomicrobiota bacterium]|nr:DUF5691 domain-containing protein [Verrucomicrobiota bacterium]
MKLSDLAQTAMLGTERQTLPNVTGSSALVRLLGQLNASERENSLLAAAALCALHEGAGALPPRDPAAPEAECAPESQSCIPVSAVALVRRLLEGEYPGLFPECLVLMTRAQRLIPPELVPQALETGIQRAELREALFPVLGRRGHWLAAQNPAWAWVTSDTLDEGVWQTGSMPARIQLFRQLRHSNPERAVSLLEATWKEEEPEDRSAFVAEMATGLGSSDEPFLEAALTDKRKEVRRAAARLLAVFPESAYTQRMRERVRPLLVFTAGQAGAALKLKRAKKASLEVTLPAACDPAMQRDAIEPRPPAGTGEKAWWLIQMLEAVPLKTWTSEWSVTPEEIITASQASEWKKDLFEGWTRAAIRQRDSAWADALFEPALGGDRPTVPAELMAVLSPARREARLMALLTADAKKTRELHGALLAQCRHDWSPEFARIVLAYLRKESAREFYDWQVRNQLKEWARYLPSTVFAEAASGWNPEAKAWEFWSKGVDELLAAIQFRADLQRTFSL